MEKIKCNNAVMRYPPNNPQDILAKRCHGFLFKYFGLASISYEDFNQKKDSEKCEYIKRFDYVKRIQKYNEHQDDYQCIEPHKKGCPKDMRI